MKAEQAHMFRFWLGGMEKCGADGKRSSDCRAARVFFFPLWAGGEGEGRTLSFLKGIS